jgi:outer membrane immunogenic protein
MNKLFLATAALAIAATGTAGAADLAYKAAPMAPPAVTWTGCYVSGGLGYGMWNQQHFGETDPGHVQLTPAFTSGGEGWLGRVGVGCDYQVAPSFVIGAFGDFDFMNLKSKNFSDVQGIGAIEKESRAWAAGGRVGYLPYPNLLTFVSGGFTQAHFDRQDLFDTTGLVATPLPLFIDAHTYNGAFIGGGYEYRLPWFQGLTWKTEYRYNWYRADDLPVFLSNGTLTGVAEHMEKTVQTVTTSLVWRFDFGGPVVGRY